MRPRPFLLLLAGFALALMAAGEADAEKEPEWKYYLSDSAAYYSDVAISADGEYIAVGSSYGDNKVYLFHKESFTPIWKAEMPYGTVMVDISADGGYIVVGTASSMVYLFDKDSGTPLWNYTLDVPDYDQGIKSVAISADGEYIIAGTYNNRVYLFDKDDSTPLWNYSGGRWADISADGEYIVTCCSSDKVFFFNKDNNTPLWNYSVGKVTGFYPVSISADGGYIAVMADKDLYFFGRDNGTPLWSSSTEGWSGGNSAISADGEYIIAGSQKDSAGHNEKAKIILFGKDSDIPLWTYGPIRFETHDWMQESGGTRIGISADGEYIAAGTNGGNVFLFDKDNYIPLWEYNGSANSDSSRVSSLAISANGEYTVAVIAKCGWVSDDNWECYDGELYLFFNEEASDLNEEDDEDESSLPSISLIPALVSIGLIALFRRK